MNRLLRTVGFGLILLGIVMILVWAIEPLQMLWPWIRALPLPMRIGVLAAVLGLAVLLGSLIWERLREREADKDLLDEM
jgi:hypothetical protein